MKTPQMKPTPRIFFVEDDTDDRAILEDVLLHLHVCEATLFTDGYELLEGLQEAATTGLPALLVMDYHLPIWKAETLIRIIKKNPRYANIPVMVLSSTVGVKDKRALLKAGARAVTDKPDSIGAYNHLCRQLAALAIHGS